MSVECTSCGHLIPAGQFRCGRCGGLAPRESLEDFGGLTEVVADGPAAAQVPPSSPPLVVPGAAQPQTVESAAHAPAHHVERAHPEPAPPEPHAAEEPAEVDPMHAKEYAVPKGTFASEMPHPAPAPSRNADASGEVKAVARDFSEPVATTPNSATSSAQRLKEPRVATRPPFLASEILREDLTPLEPGKRIVSVVAHVAGGFGLIGSLLLGYGSAAGIMCAIACVGMVALGRVRLEYATRAAAMALLSGAGLVGAALVRLSLGASHDDPVLAAACALLPAALLYRHWYRASPTARALVAGSLVFAVAWAAMTSHRGLLTLGFSWQSWLPALAWYVFGILCLLSLLAFMADETTGGCGVWALGVSVWFALFVCLRAAMEVETFAVRTREAATALGVAEAAFAAPLAAALAQLYSRALTPRRRTAVARG
jgi:hypothetical protein